MSLVHSILSEKFGEKYSSPKKLEEERKVDIAYYLTGRKKFPGHSKEIAKLIIGSENYQGRLAQLHTVKSSYYKDFKTAVELDKRFLELTLKEKKQLSVLNGQLRMVGKVEESLYLRYASAKVWEFFNEISYNYKLHFMKHVQYIPEGIQFFDEEGKAICVFYDADVDVTDNELIPGEIEKANGVTYFRRRAMLEYGKEKKLNVPTRELFEKLLRLMPGSTSSINPVLDSSREEGGLLHSLLGGTLSGWLENGVIYHHGDAGFYLSSNSYKNTNLRKDTSSSWSRQFAVGLMSRGFRSGFLEDFCSKKRLYPFRAVKSLG